MFRWPPREYMTVEWGGLEFTTDPRGGDAPHLLIRDFSGWSDGWTDSSSTAETPGGRGVMVTERKVSPRAVSLTAYASWEAPLLQDSESLFSLIETLEDADGDLLLVREPGIVAREASVRVISRSITPVSRFSAVLSLTMQADDPLRYSADEVALPAGRTVTLRNRGTHDSGPFVTVTGPTKAAPKVRFAGSTVTAPRALTKGQVWTVDYAEGEMRVNGSLVFPMFKSWPTIARGGSASCMVSEGVASVKRVSAWR